jgi:hypothetical protein
MFTGSKHLGIMLSNLVTKVCRIEVPTFNISQHLLRNTELCGDNSEHTGDGFLFPI